jgi:hypothetical protein
MSGFAVSTSIATKRITNLYDFVSMPSNIEHELQAKVAQPLRMQRV